jgi:restriction system protein
VVQQQRAALEQQRRMEQARRAADRAVRDLEAARLRANKQQVAAYLASRERAAPDQTREVEGQEAALQSLLKVVVGTPTGIDFERFNEPFRELRFEPGFLAYTHPPPNPTAFESPKPGGLLGVPPGPKQKYLEAVRAGRAAFDAAQKAWEAAEANRATRLDEARTAHELAMVDLRRTIEAQHAEVDALAAAFAAGEPQAVIQYFSLILAKSMYPEDFPPERRVAFVPESTQLVVEIELPTMAAPKSSWLSGRRSLPCGRRAGRSRRLNR